MPARWYYITAICDYGTNTLSIYVDGTLTGTATIPWGAANRLTRNITTGFGNFKSDTLRSYNGKIDEVKFWKGVRTVPNILADSAGCATLPTPNLIAYFKAKEGMGIHAASTVDTNFRGVNNAHWSTNAPVSICGACCDSATAPTVKIMNPSVTVCDTTTDSVKIVVRVSHLTPGTPWTVTLSDGSVASGVAGTGSYDSVIIKVHPTTTTTYTISTSSISSQPCAMVIGVMTITIIQCSNPNHTGVDEYNTATTCRVYPNPGNGMFTVELDKTPAMRLITIVDIHGSVITRSEANGDKLNFDISHVPSGVYNIIITTADNVITKRIVVTK
jgi:hypothetical protein